MRTEDKETIYRAILRHYTPGSTPMLSTLIHYLGMDGIDYTSYGYEKAKDMCYDCPEFLSIEDVVIGGQMHQKVHILEWQAQKDNGLQTQQMVQTLNFVHVQPSASTQEAEPDESFESLIDLSPRTLESYALHTGQTTDEALRQIKTSFEAARGSMDFHRGTPTFNTPVARIQLNRNLFPDRPPWHLMYALFKPAPVPVERAGEEEAPTMTTAQKREVYGVLRGHLTFGAELHMAQVAAVLSSFAPKERYGFSKMKQFLQAMPEFITLREEILNGPQTMVTLTPVPEWDKAGDAQESAPQPMTEPQTAAPAPAQPSGDVPLGMEDQVLLSRRPLEVLHKLMTGEENQMPPRSVIDALMRNYAAAAAAGKVVQSGDFYTFETGLADQNGVPINASIKRADYGTFPWYLSYIGNHAGKADAPGKRLEQFAFLGSWQSFLRDLAAIALPEPWDFENRGDYREHHILQKYIQYTFYRLTQEGGKILTSDDERFAAFNTGLVTPHYDDIYACFEASSDEYDTKWRFLEFCTKGRRGTGKRLVETFNPLPQPARYFERREDLLFDLDKDLHTDYDHIILDNVSRLPLEFLREECHGCAEALECIERIDRGEDKRSAYSDLSDVIADQPRLFNRIRNRISDAIEFAKKQVRWNFKTAIPCYFPTRNVMSLMLPLSLCEEGRPDVALVVELTRSGNYQGQTILTLQQAYIDGRLLCRPDSEWLNTRVIATEEAQEEEE